MKSQWNDVFKNQFKTLKRNLCWDVLTAREKRTFFRFNWLWIKWIWTRVAANRVMSQSIYALLHELKRVIIRDFRNFRSCVFKMRIFQFQLHIQLSTHRILSLAQQQQHQQSMCSSQFNSSYSLFMWWFQRTSRFKCDHSHNDDHSTKVMCMKYNINVYCVHVFCVTLLCTWD